MTKFHVSGPASPCVCVPRSCAWVAMLAMASWCAPAAAAGADPFAAARPDADSFDHARSDTALFDEARPDAGRFDHAPPDADSFVNVQSDPDPFAAARPVDDAVLADARGGFETGNGLLVSLSVDRALSLNGNVVASDRLALAGEGLLHGLGQPLAALVLQNDANGQLIRSQTTINATVASLAALKSLNFADSLRQALATPVVPR
jgi:hypothetical protein